MAAPAQRPHQSDPLLESVLHAAEIAFVLACAALLIYVCFYI